ncbi:MAG: DUF2309 domain-containing protein [Chitinophagaceae bacterium]|nr:DUF2309 domain-containing protein [Chitinophagaceae bacterium]
MNRQELKYKIDKAAHVIGKTWPLYSFVTANPLSGFEDLPFLEGVELAGNLWDARVLPGADIFRKAWDENKIGAKEIEGLLHKAGKDETPEYYLAQLEAHHAIEHLNETHEIDRLTVKWVSLFLDEGMADWPMPFKELGFYTAWRGLIIYDDDINKKLGGSIPKTPEEALFRVLENFDEADHIQIFERHLAALPGWAGFIKYRVENGSLWDEEYPITLLDFLAVRLWMARCIKAPILPKLPAKKDHSLLELKYIWLRAWEQTWQNRLFEKMKNSAGQMNEKKDSGPDAQLVFCLDSRSEILRRLLEQYGNYETFGSAGAFGLPMNYRNPKSGLINKSSPAMLPSKYLVHEETAPGQESNVLEYKKKEKRISAYKYFLKRLKNILPSAFGFVEGSGIYYGTFMLLRIFKPKTADRLTLHYPHGYENIYEPHICAIDPKDSLDEITPEEKASLVKGVFDSCGWRNFAPLVVFAGHASHSANNPYASSLDCGACAGNPGKRNARTLARLANSKEVQKILLEKHNIEIPEDTIFIAAEHITSTDEVELFDIRTPESHRKILQQLKKNLSEIKQKMTTERLGEPQNAVALAKIKSSSWSESRPEYGLSGHAGYIIGPRSLTMNEEFSDCFLSSYDWRIDKDGSILKGIMQGPLLVCQWISDHYYFSTVDNDFFGAGSKITLNITGKYGTVQGNGSDLKMGLPLQSLMKSDNEVFHNPIRLTTLIQAPGRFIDQVLSDDETLKNLVENDWIYLFVMDPERNNSIELYSHLVSVNP